jgi:hypothetical protein
VCYQCELETYASSFDFEDSPLIANPWTTIRYLNNRLLARISLTFSVMKIGMLYRLYR